MKKRILSLLLAATMLLSLVPMTAFATGTEEVGGKTLPYSFDFETDMKAEGWTNIDADGDGQDWITGTNIYEAEGWGVEGSRCAISQSYDNNLGAFNANNWLFSPAITIPEGGATVSWYEQSQDVSCPDFYEVYVSETNTSTDTSKMTKIFSGTAANPWNQRSVELEAAEYAGKTVYIAFRHLCYDCYILEIDDFAVGAEAPAHTHTVTFDANGGSVTPTSAETGTDGKLATLPTPTRSGYSFVGWYTAAIDGTKITAEKVYTADTAIYAHWASFAHLPETGVANITVPAGNYDTGVAAKDAFILYWGENIETDGDFLLIDYVDTDINGYHSWMITIKNGDADATDGHFTEYYTILDLINNTTSYDCWVNGTYSAIHTHAFTYTADNGKITATCVDGCDDGYDTNPLTLTLTAPASLVYNGYAKAFTFADGEAAAWTGAGLELPIITYAAKSGSSLTSDKAVDAGSYTASVTVDTDKTASLDFEITKATPYIKTNPEPTAIELGKKLADSTIVDGYVYISSTDSTEVAGLFAWTQPDTMPAIADSNVTLYDLIFTPVDEKNYNTVTCQVTITVNHTHNPKLVNGQAPQKGIAGWKDYYECICGERYEDASGSILIPDLAVWKAEGGNGYLAPLIPAMYTVTFNMGNQGTQIDPQTVEEGNKAIKPADPTASGYIFGGWYADATFSTKFDFNTAITANTTVYAKWTKNTPAPSGDSTPTVTVPVTGDENSVKVSATVSGSTATIKDIKDADLAKVTGGESVEIDLTGLKKDIDTAKIPSATVEKIGEQAGMSVKLTTATVSFDKTATQEISDQAKGNTVELVVDYIKEVSLNAVQKEAIKQLDTAIIIDAHLVSNGSRLCTEENGGFGGGKAKVILPYEIESNRTAENYIVYYVNEAGQLEKLNAVYDEELQAFVFEIEHFSNYVVAYDENACPQDETCVYAKFTDADTKAWYHDGVHFCVENGYMQGVSADKFDPSGTLSRGMIVTMLWHMEGEPVVNYAMSFKDVKADQWYTEAIRWAQSTGVVDGYSADSFGPNDNVTREQLAAILYNYAKIKGQGFTGGWMFLLDFADRTDISSWANEAVHWCSMKGIINGKDGKVFDPQGNATRAEAATMVQRYCEAFKK